MIQVRQGHELPQVNPAKERHLEVVARLHRRADVDFGFRQDLERAHQILCRELRRQRAEPLALAVGRNFRIVHP